MEIEKLTTQLSDYLPEGTESYVAEMIIEHKVQFKISRPRNTKLGDYKYPLNNQVHKISVNNDLNPYQFLLTTIHEFAHLVAFKEYGREIKPHGILWKYSFFYLFSPLLDKNIFPKDVEEAFGNYFKNPAATSLTDENLVRVLRRYDKRNVETRTVESLNDGEVFQLNNKIFVRGRKLRKYYLCQNIVTKREYRVAGLAVIEPVKLNEQ